MSYKPTQAMADNAQAGMNMRDKATPSNKGGTSVGFARANQFIKRENVTLDTVKRTYSFLKRAEVYYQPGSPTPGTQAYLMWGGNAGLTWATKILRQEGLIND
jgi:hypothetical protein